MPRGAIDFRAIRVLRGFPQKNPVAKYFYRLSRGTLSFPARKRTASFASSVKQGRMKVDVPNRMGISLPCRRWRLPKVKVPAS